jgi:N6-L-threonylcarbamoyladenine synthase
LLVGAAVGSAIAFALGRPAIGIHHLEGHLLSPLLSADPPAFPFVALLVSGGHTQLMRVDGVGRYTMLGETVDDAAGEAFDKSAKLLGLGYPGGPALAHLAEAGRPGRFDLPRPKLHSGDLDFSFSGLKTAVRLAAERAAAEGPLNEQTVADLARAVQEAIVDTLVIKCARAVEQQGWRRLVVAGGVGANALLRERLGALSATTGAQVHFPALEFCTDNGAMIAYAGWLRTGRRGTQRHRGGCPSALADQRTHPARGPFRRGCGYTLMRDSVPSIRRRMFARWRQISSSESVAVTVTNAASPETQAIAAGAIAAATSADSDE